MRGLLIALFLIMPAVLTAQQQDGFRWVNFHSSEDASTIAWVRRSLDPEKWTAIREIGVQYDAALVMTTERATPQSLPAEDKVTVWSVSLTSRKVYVLVHGVNLRMTGWIDFSGNHSPELGALYDNCAECAADTYFTAFHYDFSQHMWLARWMRGDQAVPLWNAKPPSSVELTQAYALMADPDGHRFLVTWKHFDYGKEKAPEDFLYQYDLDPDRELERTMQVYGRQAEAMKLRLCRGENSDPGMSRGQDSPLCQRLVGIQTQRKPATTPPANNHGQSVPPGTRRR